MIFSNKRFIAIIISLFSVGANAAVQVVTTVPVFAWMTEAVGGEHVDVRYLASPTQDPHYVDARPSFIPLLHKADLLILAGLQLEAGWLPSLIQNARNPKINPGATGYVDASTVIQSKGLAMGTSQPISRAQGDLHPGGNPHYYFDPGAMKEVLPLIVSRLSAVDPEHALDYRASQSELDHRLTQLIEDYRQKLKGLRVVGYHQSFQNLFRTFGIENPVNIEPFPGIPPSSKHIAKVALMLKSHQADGIVAEMYYPSKIVDTVAKVGKAKLVRVSPGQKKQDIVSWYQDILDGLARLKPTSGPS